MKNALAMDTVVFDATGNRFLLADAWRGEVQQDLDIARTSCDGILELRHPTQEGDVRMVLWNRDGSRATFCGNGLRCIAKAAVERGYVDSTELIVETDSGPRRVRAQMQGATVVAATAEMGPARIVRRHVIKDERVERGGFEVDVGNMHLVLFVRELPALEDLALEDLAQDLSAELLFPDGVNIECVERRDSGLALRVYERGVGETRSCGSGVTAAALAAEEHWGTPLPLEVETRGGRLRVERDAEGRVWTGGSVTETRSDPVAHRVNEERSA